MGAVIAAHGVQSEKVVDGQRRQVVPFVGTDREGEFAQMGIGLVYPDGGGTFWGCVVPHLLIQSWRGMKILERIERIGHGTLCGCWTIARRDVHTSDKRHLDELAEQVGGADKLQVLRDEVLASVPGADEINAMITSLREKGVDVDSWELEEEVKAGRIAMSPLIEMLVRETEERRQAYQREEEEIKRPLSCTESLGAFFEDLGIVNFLDGPAFGAYGMDWGHIKLDELDQFAKRASFSKYLSDGFHLEHTTSGPETISTKIGQGVTMFQTSFGEIEQPYFTAVDGVRYTFLSAKWMDGYFYIRTLISQPEMMGPPQASNLTIAELRSMIGSIPSKSATWRSVLSKAAALFR